MTVDIIYSQGSSSYGKDSDAENRYFIDMFQAIENQMIEHGYDTASIKWLLERSFPELDIKNKDT